MPRSVPWALKPPTPVDFIATPWRLAWVFLSHRCTRDRTFDSCFQLSNFLFFFSFRFPDSSDGAPLAQHWRSPRDKTSGHLGRAGGRVPNGPPGEGGILMLVFFFTKTTLKGVGVAQNSKQNRNRRTGVAKFVCKNIRRLFAAPGNSPSRRDETRLLRWLLCLWPPGRLQETDINLAGDGMNAYGHGQSGSSNLGSHPVMRSPSTGVDMSHSHLGKLLIGSTAGRPGLGSSLLTTVDDLQALEHLEYMFSSPPRSHNFSQHIQNDNIEASMCA